MKNVNMPNSKGGFFEPTKKSLNGLLYQKEGRNLSMTYFIVKKDGVGKLMNSLARQPTDSWSNI